MIGKSFARETLCQNISNLLGDSDLCDFTLRTEGREVPCVKAIVAAQSPVLREVIRTGAAFLAVSELVKVLHFAHVDLDGLDFLEILAFAEAARFLQIDCIPQEEILSLAVSNLTVETCLEALFNQIVDFVRLNFFRLIENAVNRKQLLSISRGLFVEMVCVLISECREPSRAKILLLFCLEWAKLESLCDLLRESKNWGWPPYSASQGSGGLAFRSPISLLSAESATARMAKVDEGYEWEVWKLAEQLLQEPLPSVVPERMPVRMVAGRAFDWFVRLDAGPDDKLRVVYDAAIERPAADERDLVVKRFPAANFAWQVRFRGQNMTNDKGVFVCFPHNVNLQWSTNLPVAVGQVGDEELLVISVQMTELPLVSLILFEFSEDLHATISSENILNRLPHIEYRCLSSFALVEKQISANPETERAKTLR